MTKKSATIISVLSLVVSFLSILFMLDLNRLSWVGNVLLVFGVVLMIAVALTMVPRKFHFRFLEICREPAPLLKTRLAISVVLFSMGWYLNGAMNQVYGAESLEVASNGIAMLTPLFAMFGHVVYLGCVKKAKTWQKPIGK